MMKEITVNNSDEFQELVDNKGLTFGMNVAKYKLDMD